MVFLVEVTFRTEEALGVGELVERIGEAMQMRLATMTVKDSSFPKHSLMALPKVIQMVMRMVKLTEKLKE
jgi:hypothetical protein